MRKQTILTLGLAALIMLFSSGIQAGSANEALDPMNPSRRTRENYSVMEKGKSLESTSTFKTKSPYTGTSYTHKGKFSGYTIQHGVDVSYWQHSVNWTKVKNDGISFAFLRCGYRTYSSSGGLYSDSTFKTNIANARKAGIKVGVYIFSQALNEKEARDEANFILKAIKGYSVDLPLIMDYEYASGRFKSGTISRKQATKNVNAFCKVIKDAGYTPMLYGSTSFLNSQLNMSDITCKVWVAQYNYRNTYEGNYEYWQYSSSGKVKGISGNCDVNFRYYSSPKNTETSTYLSWKQDDEAEGYVISRYNEKTGKYEEIKRISSNGTTAFKDSNLSPATVYLYRVESVRKISVTNSDGVTEEEEVRNILIDKKALVTLPEKTGSLKAAKRTKSKIKLSWGKVKNATGYEVYRYSAKAGKYKLIKRTANTTHVDSSLTKGLAYKYRVRAYKKYSGKYYCGKYSSSLLTHTKGTYLKKARGTKKVKTSTLNVRKGPGTEYKKTAKLKKGKKVKITGYSKDLYRRKWFKIKFKSGSKTRKGYVYASYVK